MTSRATTHVVFDLDGVLLDTEPLYTRATQEIVDEFGKVFDWSIKGDMIGRGQLDGAEYLVRALDLPITAQEYLRRRLPKLEVLFPNVAALPGAESLVASLRATGVPMAIATSGERSLTELKLSRHAWLEEVEVIVCGDDAGIRPKPAPDIFLVAARRLGAAATRCVVVEDSLAGVAAALSAGMRCIAVPDSNMDATRYSDAHAVVRSLTDVTLRMLGLE